MYFPQEERWNCNREEISKLPTSLKMTETGAANPRCRYNHARLAMTKRFRLSGRHPRTSFSFLTLTFMFVLMLLAKGSLASEVESDLVGQEDFALEIEADPEDQTTSRSEDAKGRQLYYPRRQPNFRGRPYPPPPLARREELPAYHPPSRRRKVVKYVPEGPFRPPRESMAKTERVNSGFQRRRNNIQTASSNRYNFREWESKKMNALQAEDEDDVPPSAFTPSNKTPYFPLFPEFPEVDKGLPEIKNRAPPYTPRPMIPTRHPPRERTTQTFERPYSAFDTKPGNQMVNLQTEFFNLPTPRPTIPSRLTISKRPSRIPVLVKKLGKRPIPKDRKKKKIAGVTIIEPPGVKNLTNFCLGTEAECGINQGNGTKSELLSFLRAEVWVVPIIVSAGALVAVLLIFEIYLISKAIAANPSGRHLFLGQMLMLGLMASCAMAVVISLKPTMITCAVSRIGIGLSYTVIYATLLVKLVFLISLNSGVYLPATYQCLLLCFALLIQVVIGIQWLISAPSDVLHMTLESGQVYSTCNVNFHRHILGLLYVIFLVLVVVILSFKSRGVRENYREAMYIGLTMGFTVCIFTIWILAGFISPAIYSDVCMAGGLVGCAAITFVIMFMPKGRQLSAMGREGVYDEDRNDVYTGSSSTQSTASGGTPSPSFFPIKPGKLVHQFRDREFQRDRLDTPPSPRKLATSFPPPPPPIDPHHHRRTSHHNHNHHHHLHSDMELDDHRHHHHHHHHNHQDHFTMRSRESMDNFVGTDSMFRNSRWRSRSSPAAAHRVASRWHPGEASSFGYPPRNHSPPRNFLHSSFHDLHAANEMRASRHDLQEMRDLLRQGHGADFDRRRSTRRSLHERKWPPPMPGSPSCPRCVDSRRY